MLSHFSPGWSSMGHPFFLSTVELAATLTAESKSTEVLSETTLAPPEAVTAPQRTSQASRRDAARQQRDLGEIDASPSVSLSFVFFSALYLHKLRECSDELQPPGRLIGSVLNRRHSQGLVLIFPAGEAVASIPMAVISGLKPSSAAVNIPILR